MVISSGHRPRPIVIRLRVSNLPFSTTAGQLAELFSEAGPVRSVDIIRHAETAYPRGFAFVIMATPSASSDAIARFNGAMHGGRLLHVAYERDTRPVVV
jgi:cold-inducible RNA-binding protein